MSSERTERMRLELESMDIRLEDERKRSAELLEQVVPLFIHIRFVSLELSIAFHC